MSNVFLKENRYLYFSDANLIVNTGINDLFIRYAPSKKIAWDEIPINQDIIKSRVHHLNQIIFETSQRCNMKCCYCIYGGSYFYQRKNESKSILFETARKTIDYIHEFIKKRPKKELIIGFYGGEPLLNFDVIKKIVGYCKQIFPGWQLRFTITTNGTLLNDKIIHFLVKNRFVVMISLDGDEKVHDKKRILFDGSGTYRRIMKNVKKIKTVDNEYYREKVFYIITYSKDLPFDEVFNFFLNEDIVKKNPITLNFVNHLDTDYYDKFPYDSFETNAKINKIIKALTEKKYHKHSLSPIEEELFNRIGDMEKRTRKRRLSYLAESCLFDKRLYIDADGKFHICEKMNHRFPFGDCDKGFDFKRMTEIAQEFMALIKQKCRECDARFLCSRCYIHFAKNGVFEINPEFCETNKSYIRKLEKIIELKERGIL
jgi:uncharacterized protein